jgi:hypothetical protein
MSAVRVKRQLQRRICQGDIIRDVEFLEYARERADYVEISKINYPLVVVLTQDCDLSQDYGVRWSRQDTPTHDKAICSVLVAPIYNAEHVYVGEHLSELNLQAQAINKNKTPGKSLRSNEVPRYHYCEFPEGIPLPSSIVDFKHYFSVSVEYLKKRKRVHFVCQLATLYREDLSLRFASFLSRIGLPAEKRRPLARPESPTTLRSV